RTPERVNRRNGYRERDWDTRVGSIELAVPKLRAGSYFPDWLLQPRRRAERALGAGGGRGDPGGVCVLPAAPAGRTPPGRGGGRVLSGWGVAPPGRGAGRDAWDRLAVEVAGVGAGRQ